MLSVKGIYEEGKVKLLEKIQARKRSKVIITFIDDSDLSEDEKLREFSSTGDGLAFWNSDAENIYQDYIPKSKK
jgi:hypothetical protein